MLRVIICCASMLGFPAYTTAEEPEKEAADEEVAVEDELREADDGQPTTMSGMSILGNEEAPKSLVIVPWKSSELGAELGLSNTLDDRAQPVDRDVFMRELSYYDLRSGK
jgi:hypothetical protein